MKLSKKRMLEIFEKLEKWEEDRDHEDDLLYFLQVEEVYQENPAAATKGVKENHQTVLEAANEMGISMNELMKWYRQFSKVTSKK